MASSHHLSYTPPLTRPLGSTGTADRVTQGVHRAVLDWSTGIITKLAAGLLRPAAAASGGAASGGDASGDSGERHARNARRWLSDERVWKAFVRSLEGATAAAEPSTHLPQATSLGVLRAAIFAVRAAAAAAAVLASRTQASSRGGLTGGGLTGGDLAGGSSAGEWALAAIYALCGVGGGDSTNTLARYALVDGDGCGKTSQTVEVGSGLGLGLGSGVEVRVGQKGGGFDGAVEGHRRRGRERGGGGGARMRMSLDAFMAFLEECVRGHMLPSGPERSVGAGGGGDNSNGNNNRYGNGNVNGNECRNGNGNGSGALALPEKALTELLRFQVVLQGQQNRRKVTLFN